MKRTESARITGSSVYTYASELIVELTGVDEEGDFVVLSYQFEYTSDGIATPKQDVDREHVDDVRAGLSEAGYDWTESEM